MVCQTYIISLHYVKQFNNKVEMQQLSNASLASSKLHFVVL